MQNIGVLISVQPQWVYKILEGEKVLEIRKTKPKLETPFKCYIYMTAGDYHYRKDGWLTAVISPSGHLFNGSQTVVAEFICDRIDTVVGGTFDDHTDLQEQSCLTEEQLQDYLKGKTGYGWHISELRVYETPKALDEFSTLCKMNCWGWEPCESDCPQLKRPPQSWCYVQQMVGSP